MSEQITHSLQDRWNAFAKRHGIKDFKATPRFDRGNEVLYVQVGAGEISAPFETEEQTLQALRNYGLQLLEPQGNLGIYITLLLIKIVD